MKIVEIVCKSGLINDEVLYASVDENRKMLLEEQIEILIKTSMGIRCGIISSVFDANESQIPVISATIIRNLNEKDINQIQNNEKESKEALLFAQQQADKLQLTMRFVSSFYVFDRKQLYLTYVSDNRIDFRELAKVLAQKYKTRIELRQIGVRDKAKQIGGLGPCGLFLCCNTFLTDFVSVSINMAKNQNLALSPSKINGLCGRLLCCLNYEDDLYTELRKKLPSIGTDVEFEHKHAKVIDVNFLKRTYQVELENKEIVTVEV